MLSLLVSRGLQSALIVALVVTFSFLLIHSAPGDPFAGALDNPRVNPAIRANLRAQYGLDRPLPEQYVKYVAQLARGNLGWSFSRGRSVRAVLGDVLPRTLLLMATALVASFLIGVGVATVQVSRRGSALDGFLDRASLFLASMPDFWLAILILLAFSYWIPFFSIGGAVDPVVHDMLPPYARFFDSLWHLILPAVTLTLLYASGIARFQRGALLDVMPLDFIRTARSKGLRERQILLHHAMRNALLTLITLIGLSFPALLTGAVFIEKVFAWPGMGLAMVGAIGARDYPLVIGCVIVGSVLVVLGSLLADLLYRWADPRLRQL
ncbi:MAG: ABC transporter permease [Gemmatimonadaceae bacterium]|nr:ABC transporter permease [Gemmatimonadaceae bacterium]